MQEVRSLLISPIPLCLSFCLSPVKRERVDDSLLKVTRRVSNTFWLIRNLLPYGEDCETIAPDSVRRLIAHKRQTAAARYE
jgi:predicted DNA-binding transcriptional regulator YafY